MKISVVIPCYKEGAIIARTVSQVLDAIQSDTVRIECEVILVVEHSAAPTLQVARLLEENDARVKVLANDKCYGKGYSVRKGVLATTGDLILVNDADLPVDLVKYFPLMLRLMSGEQVGAVYLTAFGDKTDTRKRGFLRAELTYGLFALRRWFLKQTITDTQLGCKLYNGDMARYLMLDVDEPGFLYELQMTDLIEWSQYRIEECAVRINRFSRESSVSVKAIFKNLYAFFKYIGFKRSRLFLKQMLGSVGYPPREEKLGEGR